MADWSIYFPQLLYAYLHGHPFLPGTGPGTPPHRVAEMAEIGSGPWPWEPQGGFREIQAIGSVLSAVSLRAAASGMPEGPQKTAFERAMNARIAELIDDYCGTPPHHSPYPGPTHFGYAVAAGLSFIAGTMREGGLQAAVENAALRALERVALNPQPLPP